MEPVQYGYAALVKEARQFAFPAVSPRNDIVGGLPKPAPFNLVHIITGIRRCGKTFYAFQLARGLLDSGVPRNRIFYFNFADDRLRPPSNTLMSDVLEEYWRQVPDARNQGCYLFLDEVQEAPGWQGVLQRLAEHERVTLVVTGSSSKMSSDEIASTFRGRSLEHPMLPLSFGEYCQFHGVVAPSAEEAQAGAISPRQQTELQGLFDRYLTEGGFPGVQPFDRATRIQMLQSYMRDVVARDVVERYERVDISLANQVALFGLRNTGCELSINRLVDDLRAVGYKTSWETVNETVRLFCQAHLFDLLPEYTTALSPSSRTPDKIYAVDQGMAYAVSRASQQDVGKRLETVVYLELKRRLLGSRIETITSYTAPTSKREKVDFLVGDALGTEPYELYQVTVAMSSEKTRRRELGSLTSAMEHTRIGRGYVITLRDEGMLETEGGTIHVIPAWRWALMA